MKENDASWGVGTSVSEGLEDVEDVEGVEDGGLGTARRGKRHVGEDESCLKKGLLNMSLSPWKFSFLFCFSFFLLQYLCGRKARILTRVRVDAIPSVRRFVSIRRRFRNRWQRTNRRYLGTGQIQRS